MEICIFEDEHFGRLEPLVFARPVFDLLCGINTLLEKILCYIPDAPSALIVRSPLAALTRQRHPDIPVNQIASDDCLFINGRLLADPAFMQSLSSLPKENIVFLSGEEVAAARLTGQAAVRIAKSEGDYLPGELFDGIKAEQVSVKMISYAWDLLRFNKAEILQGANYQSANKIPNAAGLKREGVYLINPEQIFVDPGVALKPGVVLDATDGPVVIAEAARLCPNAVVEGPVAIGAAAQIKSGAWLYGGSTIGKNCKIGGEVEHAIFHPNSNKQHAGFIGNACLGSWVNLGADTNCSDLKNNYSAVSVTVNSETLNTGLQFLGLLMGDHSKSAINTMFNTGTVVGYSANIFGGEFPPKYIPSFSWGGAASFVTYDVAKSIETARRVLERRNMTLSEAEEQLFHYIFRITQGERRKRGYSD